MKKSDQTRISLALSLEKLMEHQPLEKITIQDISDQAGVSRQTFYRLFTNKYALIEWYLEYLILRIYEQLGITRDFQSCVEEMLLVIDDKLPFFTDLFKDNNIEKLTDGYVDAIVRFFINYLRIHKPQTMSDPEIASLFEIYCKGSVNAIILNALHHTPNNIKKWSVLFVNALPNKIYLAFKELHLV